MACFDTAFHATMPAEASTLAVPVEWREEWGVRRYGFHGLSHAEAALDWDSGLLGVSGVGSEPRELYPAADTGDEAPRLALDVYLHRLAAGVAAMATSAGGLDAITFHRGDCENDPPAGRRGGSPGLAGRRRGPGGERRRER